MPRHEGEKRSVLLAQYFLLDYPLHMSKFLFYFMSLLGHRDGRHKDRDGRLLNKRELILILKNVIQTVCQAALDRQTINLYEFKCLYQWSQSIGLNFQQIFVAVIS